MVVERTAAKNEFGRNVLRWLRRHKATVTQHDVPETTDFVRIMSLHKSKGLTRPAAAAFVQQRDGGERGRQLRPDMTAAIALPGAAAAVDAARQAGNSVVIVTAAPAVIATTMLLTAGLGIDRLRASVWAAGKVQPLPAEGCWAFVGDHTGDMQAARDAGAIAIGVTTGTGSPVSADIAFESLEQFGPWLARRDAKNMRPA